MNSPEYGDIARPDLPRPNCRVKLVCGPVAAGKSTYVRRFAGKGDIVIDLDTIGPASPQEIGAAIKVLA